MAVLKRIKQGSGDGAGRAPYALKKAVAFRTDMPSSLILTGAPLEEIRNELAREFNRHLKLHQGSYKTQHFIVSFGHRLTAKEVERALDKLENLFKDPLRLHLFAVHQEEHGTAIHIIESGDPWGKLRHLSQKEFYDLKRAVIRELRSLLTEREKEVARNFAKGIATQDWKHQVEVKAPHRSFKERIRQAIKEVVEFLNEGKIDQAVELLRAEKIELIEVKAGELSPTGKRVSRNNLYAVYRGEKTYAVRLPKKMKATFSLYKEAFERVELELRRLEEEVKRGRGKLRDIGRRAEESYRAVRRLTSGKGEVKVGSREVKGGGPNLRKPKEDRLLLKRAEEVRRKIRELRERLKRINASIKRAESELKEFERRDRLFKELGVNDFGPSFGGDSGNDNGNVKIPSLRARRGPSGPGL